MTPTDPAAIRSAIMRNARAVQREQLRNEAVRRWGPADADTIEQRVQQLVSEKTAAAGRKGAAVTRHRLAVARQLTDVHADLVAQAEALLAALRAAGQVGCEHDWPDDLDAPDAACGRCGLAYAEWTARRAVAA